VSEALKSITEKVDGLSEKVSELSTDASSTKEAVKGIEDSMKASGNDEVKKMLEDVGEDVKGLMKSAKSVSEKSSTNMKYNKAIYGRLKAPLLIKGTATTQSKNQFNAYKKNAYKQRRKKKR